MVNCVGYFTVQERMRLQIDQVIVCQSVPLVIRVSMVRAENVY